MITVQQLLDWLHTLPVDAGLSFSAWSSQNTLIQAFDAKGEHVGMDLITGKGV